MAPRTETPPRWESQWVWQEFSQWPPWSSEPKVPAVSPFWQDTVTEWIDHSKKEELHPNPGLPQRELVYKVCVKWGILSPKSGRRREYLRRIAIHLAPPQLPLREEGRLGHRESLLLGGYKIYSALKNLQCKIRSLGNRAVSCEDWQEALAAWTRLGNSLPSCRALVRRPAGQPA